jgi:thiamine-monophosphate kinase
MPIGSASDEPTRLANIISTVFAGQAGWAQGLSGDERVELLVGADAQDDCAVFGLRGSMDLVVGSDYVRGAKFSLYELGYLDYFDIGYYLTMANFSDIAAMGAIPIGLLSVIRYPKSMSDDHFRSVVEGIDAACKSLGALNVGGDIGTAERLILSASAVGVIESGGSLLRSGARPGDRLCVTGATGVAAAAQRYFGKLDVSGKKISPENEETLISSWKRPQAKISQGRLLSTSGLATSCQDSSDGLKAAIETLAAHSGVGFTVTESALPVVGAVAEVARLADTDLTSLILGDSVDFQLACTVPEDNLGSLQALFEEHGARLHEIGVATAEPTVVLRSRDGTMGDLPGDAWRHVT